MTLEAVEKRDRRVKRMQRELDLCKFKWGHGIVDPVEALHWVPSFTATWNGIRALASTLVNWHVTDVGTAWAIAYYVRSLPDGKKRLEAAVPETIERWQREIDAQAGATA